MNIQIEHYNTSWPSQYNELNKHLGEVLAEIPNKREHIGSTSVPNLGAKPIIDILIGIDTDDRLDDTIKPMLAAGYTYFRKYEPDMPYRRLFVKLRPVSNLPVPQIIDLNDEYITGVHFVPATNIHVVVKDSPHWIRHVAFRDFLIAHPDIREEYYLLKKELSKRDFKDHLEYNKAKNSFIKEKEQQAISWFNNHN